MTLRDDGEADDYLRLMTVPDDTFHVMNAERMDIKLCQFQFLASGDNSDRIYFLGIFYMKIT